MLTGSKVLVCSVGTVAVAAAMATEEIATEVKEVDLEDLVTEDPTDPQDPYSLDMEEVVPPEVKKNVGVSRFDLQHLLI